MNHNNLQQVWLSGLSQFGEFDHSWVVAKISYLYSRRMCLLTTDSQGRHRQHTGGPGHARNSGSGSDVSLWRHWQTWCNQELRWGKHVLRHFQQCCLHHVCDQRFNIVYFLLFQLYCMWNNLSTLWTERYNKLEDCLQTAVQYQEATEVRLPLLLGLNTPAISQITTMRFFTWFLSNKSKARSKRQELSLCTIENVNSKLSLLPLK